MQDELFRHQAEVREWIKRRTAMGPQQGKGWLAGVLRDIEKKRGKQAAERLRDDIRQQWTRGSRGEPGDWRAS